MRSENSITTKQPQASPCCSADVEIPRSFIWYTVDQVHPCIYIQGLPILNEQLAFELCAALAQGSQDVQVITRARSGDDEDFKCVSMQAGRHHDLIISCRSADRPGHEYLARLGQYGAYHPRHSAPQPTIYANRGAHGGEV